MLTLGIDTSATFLSVAIAHSGQLVRETLLHSGQKHSETLLTVIDALLVSCGFAIAQIDRICVTHGPGSFTGLRIGAATAKGIAIAREIPCAGVSTLAAIAAGASELEGTLCCAMDARRLQVYNAQFAMHNAQLMRLCDDQAIAIAELEQHLPLDTPVWFCGDGAQLCYDTMQKHESWQLAPEEIRVQRAWGAILAARDEDYTCVTQLQLNYLRPSQAERERPCGEQALRGARLMSS
ncbi:MAG: tRNA (adenosine(37)-N6)-threonylcarbamoyltransferase complex dimerization subunit type 1 TsaB [Oscillospiraceae bacterium]|nr:tRNA (adenosine(37)-N6)-threonylcarbamoyltransferase complex dimerization subunit type 1 TsaB [Oscillospiraceae bacterium]